MRVKLGKHAFTVAAIGAALITGQLSPDTARAGSNSSTNTWAGDPGLLALPPGTVLASNYLGYSGNNNFIDTTGKSIGGNIDVVFDAVRFVYVTRLGSMPLLLDGALVWADASDTKLGGNSVSSQGGIQSPVLAQHLGLIVSPPEQRFLALSSFEYLPYGSYQSDKTINLNTPEQFVWVPQISYMEGLAKFGLNNVWLDVFANASFHRNGDNPITNAAATLPIGPGVPGSVSYSSLSQTTAYNLKGFISYEFMPTGHIAIGLEKSWGGLQTATRGVATVSPGVPGIGGLKAPAPNALLGKDDYLRGHLQVTMPLSKEMQVGVDLTHDFETTGGYKENFGATLRVTRFFFPAPPK